MDIMDIIVFSDNKTIKKIFSKIEKSRTYNLRFFPLSELKKSIQCITKQTLLYLDISTYTEKQLFGLLNLLDRTDFIRFGIIDTKETVKDKAQLFFKGASDYLGINQCKNDIRPARLKNIIAFKPFADIPDRHQITRAKDASAAASKLRCAKNWESIQSGNEYLFYMMFIELDGYHEIQQRVGEKAIERLLSSFQKVTANYLVHEKGRLWIWNDFGGIILFPAGNKIQGIIAACMRLMLSRRLISIEQCAQKVLLSYRIVLQTGSTMYHERGKTGRIISDSVNSLSHLGTKFARPGNFYITDDLFTKAPEALQECFSCAGEFQNTALFRMRLPVKY
ncbi:MAG: adenylate/guanylate cyclase domain-containing protein [Spirochaetales bacterium]|nr:adenylate/guanylate cyclase domain-containing protein [Spirochaetales bacterium]